MKTDIPTKRFEPRINDDGYYWLESRPENKGKVSLMFKSFSGGEVYCLSADHNVRASVHEYGGGAYAISRNKIAIVDAKTKAVFFKDKTEKQWSQLWKKSQSRIGGLSFDLSGRYLVAVEEQLVEPESIDSVVLIDTQSQNSSVLASGRDFYSSPIIQDNQAFYLAWDHPLMPWDGAELWQTNLAGEQPRCIAGGKGESVFQPQCGLDGKLYFCSDRSGLWQIYRWDSNQVEQITNSHLEIGLPQWVFGMSVYGFPTHETLAFAGNHGGQWQAQLLDLSTSECAPLDFSLPYIDSLSAAASTVVVLGDNEHALYQLHGFELAKKSFFRIAAKHDVKVSVPAAKPSWHTETIEFATRDHDKAFAFLHLPAGVDQPTVMVQCHGGPTASAKPIADQKQRFWLDRGVAILDVNHRGSTGYGRAFREKLYGHWGDMDATDCIDALLFARAQGMVSDRNAFIRGNSAGGLTALRALFDCDLFLGAIVCYPVADLEGLSADTHKFESHYTSTLVGTDPEVFRRRSPDKNVERIRTPILFFHGEKDKVAPLDHIAKLHERLLKQGVKSELVVFPDEGHGFKLPETVSRCLAQEAQFVSQLSDD